MRVYARLLPIAVPALLLVSLSVNVLQARRIETLLRPSTGGALVGTRAVDLSGLTRDGLPASVTFDDGVPTVLYYFSSRCAWCSRNWANVKNLVEAAEGRFRFIGVTSEADVAAFLTEQGLEFDLVQALEESGRRAFRFAGTPHTVVVSAQGLISHEWVGAYQGEILGQIEDLFGLVLPGLQ